MLKRAKALGEDAAQIFVKSNRRWEMPGLDEEESALFKEGKKSQDLWVCSHAGYLINVAGCGETRRTSIRALAEEIERAEKLSLATVVVHCGSHGDREPSEARRLAVEVCRPHRFTLFLGSLFCFVIKVAGFPNGILQRSTTFILKHLTHQKEGHTRRTP